MGVVTHPVSCDSLGCVFASLLSFSLFGILIRFLLFVAFGGFLVIFGTFCVFFGSFSRPFLLFGPFSGSILAFSLASCLFLFFVAIVIDITSYKKTLVHSSYLIICYSN